MAEPNDTIAYALTASQTLLKRYLEDLKPEEYTHRPAPKANCAAWLVGHLILTERQALKRMGVTDLPALPDGFEQRFARDDTAPFACDFGDPAALLPLFDQHRQRLIDAVKSAPPQQLAEPVEKPHPLFKNTGEVAHFMAIHTTMHAGQVTIIRRSLGRPPIV